MEKQTGRPAEAAPHNLILESRSRLTVTGHRTAPRVPQLRWGTSCSPYTGVSIPSWRALSWRARYSE